ncbi:MAG: RsmB/NOP family class I SAM-dependent RNA methyltransferase [Lachnospiraceae bacterium]|nr:RsmB/NOP family class I SAM-dependent RNA methyltransferase [Lachnospiraceae bacterium]MDD3794363.1 RsmB/NOP family class I SAM-dependent RNA methyltransferase [Lachnospiraceae bacterium]
MVKLPVEFEERMRDILGEEYGDFLKSYEEPRKYGLRVNTKKISAAEFERIAPFHLTKIPWIPGGYYYLEEDAPARHPFYYAGLYYLQEPSAMTPASVLEINPGEKVLDLCAAPGGKATALGAKLQESGLLVANDISASRAKALLKNLEVFGISNLFVTNAVPARLEEQFPRFFDKILVDAPCSGEGMFRKDEDTIRAWYPQKPAECARIQKDIILRAARMLRPGGRMLYSTCTFAPQENEEVIEHLLKECPQMHLCSIPEREGFSPGMGEMKECVRLWPHKMNGEGHFMALLVKEDGLPAWDWDGDQCPESSTQGMDAAGKAQEAYGPEKFTGKKSFLPKNKKSQKNMAKNVLSKSGNGDYRPDKVQQKALDYFLGNIQGDFPMEQIEVRQNQVYLLSNLLPGVSGIPFLRNGLYLGELKKDRFEPSQSLAMALSAGDYSGTIELGPEDERIKRYLKGETIEIQETEADSQSGWKLVCVSGYPLGWGKLVNGMLKNKYHPGWRMK